MGLGLRSSLLPVAFALVACQSVDSSTVDTDGLYARFAATAEGDGYTSVGASLMVGGITSTTFLRLEGGDELYAYFMPSGGSSEQAQVMSELAFGGGTWYFADFNTEAEDASFRIAFERSKTGKVSAVTSTVTLPMPIVLSTSGGNTFSRSDAAEFLVQWDPFAFTTGDELTYDISGSCIDPEHGSIVWSQGYDSLQIAQSFLDDRSGHGGETCDVNVDIILSRFGSVDSAFGNGGEFVASQKRTITLTSTP